MCRTLLIIVPQVYEGKINSKHLRNHTKGSYQQNNDGKESWQTEFSQWQVADMLKATSD